MINGTYEPLLTYLDPIAYKRLTEINERKLKEFEFRFKTFSEKYSDRFINDVINQIKNANLENVCFTEIWKFGYKMLGSDIKILDPEEPSNAEIAISYFFKKCFEVLSVEYIKFEFERQDGDDVYMTIYIKNPVKFNLKDEIEKFDI